MRLSDLLAVILILLHHDVFAYPTMQAVYYSSYDTDYEFIDCTESTEDFIIRRIDVNADFKFVKVKCRSDIRSISSSSTVFTSQQQPSALPSKSGFSDPIQSSRDSSTVSQSHNQEYNVYSEISKNLNHNRKPTSFYSMQQRIYNKMDNAIDISIPNFNWQGFKLINSNFEDDSDSVAASFYSYAIPIGWEGSFGYSGRPAVVIIGYESIDWGNRFKSLPDTFQYYVGLQRSSSFISQSFVLPSSFHGNIFVKFLGRARPNYYAECPPRVSIQILSSITESVTDLTLISLLNTWEEYISPPFTVTENMNPVLTSQTLTLTLTNVVGRNCVEGVDATAQLDNIQILTDFEMMERRVNKAEMLKEADPNVIDSLNDLDDGNYFILSSDDSRFISVSPSGFEIEASSTGDILSTWRLVSLHRRFAYNIVSVGDGREEHMFLSSVDCKSRQLTLTSFDKKLLSQKWLIVPVDSSQSGIKLYNVILQDDKSECNRFLSKSSTNSIELVSYDASERQRWIIRRVQTDKTLYGNKSTNQVFLVNCNFEDDHNSVASSFYSYMVPTGWTGSFGFSGIPAVVVTSYNSIDWGRNDGQYSKLSDSHKYYVGLQRASSYISQIVYLNNKIAGSMYLKFYARSRPNYSSDCRPNPTLASLFVGVKYVTTQTESVVATILLTPMWEEYVYPILPAEDRESLTLIFRNEVNSYCAAGMDVTVQLDYVQLLSVQ